MNKYRIEYTNDVYFAHGTDYGVSRGDIVTRITVFDKTEPVATFIGPQCITKVEDDDE